MRTKVIIFTLTVSLLSSEVFSQPDTSKRRPFPNGHRPVPGRKDTGGTASHNLTKKKLQKETGKIKEGK